jgi:hypothetical protein
MNPINNTFVFTFETINVIQYYNNLNESINIKLCSSINTSGIIEYPLILPEDVRRITCLSLCINFYNDSFVKIKEFICSLMRLLVNLKSIYIHVDSKIFEDDDDFQRFFSIIPKGIEKLKYVEDYIYTSSINYGRFPLLKNVELSVDETRLKCLSIQNRNVDVQLHHVLPNDEVFLKPFKCKSLRVNCRLINPIILMNVHERIIRSISKYLI